MMKYLVALLIITINFSCTALKKKSEENETVVEQVEEVIEEETTVLDLLPDDIDSIGDCITEWGEKERQILTKDYEDINRMKQAGDGLIYVITKVNRDGYVFHTEIQELKTTVVNKRILNMALQIVENFEFEPSDTAPKNDCGVVKFNLTTM